MRDFTIRVAKTGALISFAVTAKLICVFVFAYAKRWFSHDVAQMGNNKNYTKLQIDIMQDKIYFELASIKQYNISSCELLIRLQREDMINGLSSSFPRSGHSAT